MEEEFSMVQELTDSYEIRELSDIETEICIKIPKKYEALWAVKLSDLRATMKEIEEFENSDE